MDIQTYEKTAGNFKFDHGQFDRVIDEEALALFDEFIALGRRIEDYKKASVYADLSKRPRSAALLRPEGDTFDLKGTPNDVLHGALGIAGEASEVLEVMVKSIREGFTPEIAQELVDEGGDNLWYHIPLMSGAGSTMADELQQNFDKLDRRWGKRSYGDHD